jgi:hypothetical protein
MPPSTSSGGAPRQRNTRAMHGVVSWCACDVPHASTDSNAVPKQKAFRANLPPNHIHSCALVMMWCVTSHTINASPAKGSLRTSLPILHTGMRLSFDDQMPIPVPCK